MADGMSNVVEGELLNWAKTTDYNGPIGITVKFPVKDSDVSSFQTIYQKNHDFAKSVKGCNVFSMNRDFKSLSCFWLIEEWESIDAWKTYLLSAERSANATALMPMMEEPPHLAVYKVGSRLQNVQSDGMSNVVEGELMNWAKTTDYNGPIGITVKFPVKDSDISSFQTIYQKNHDFAKSVKGCNVFKMNRDFKSHSCFWLIEEWESIDAWKTYLLSAERSANAKALMPLMEEPPHLAVYKVGSRLQKVHSDGMSNVVEGELMNWAKTTNYSGPIGITVKFPVKVSEVSSFQAIYQKNQDFAKSQRGCNVFKMNKDFKSQSCFWVVEEWESIAAWKTYLLSQERSANADALMPMMEAPPHLAVYKVVS